MTNNIKPFCTNYIELARLSAGKPRVFWAQLNLCLGALLLVGCKPTPKPAPATSAEVNQLAADSNRFALNLFRDLAKTQENLVFSPYGIYEALAMTSAGASGTTAQEFGKLLQSSLPENRLFRATAALDEQLKTLPGWPRMKRHSTFRVSNSLWFDQTLPVEKAFQQKLQTEFRASIESLDFHGNPGAALHHINGWAFQSTEGHIPQILDQLNPSTRVILANAVYFKGGWDIEFDEQSTKPGRFSLLGGGKTKAPLMHGGGAFDYAQVEDCQALGMRFQEGPFRMLVLLPNTSQFREFEAGLTPERLGRITAALRQHRGECMVHVTLPRFQFKTAPPIQEALQSLGLNQAFTNTADFSRMSRASLLLSQILHRAFVSVDEKGAEAAAVTAISVDLSEAQDTGKPKWVDFIADHPFVFVIQDMDSGAALFMGHYLHP